MSEEQYLENRVNKQINWYSSKSSNIKKKIFYYSSYRNNYSWNNNCFIEIFI